MSLRPRGWVDREVDSGRLPVAVVGVATSSGIRELYARGDDGRTATVDDRFALFSVTKPLVAMLTMSAVEAGRIGLSLRASDVLSLDPAARTATLEHLLSHRGGLGDVPLDDPDPVGSLRRAESRFEPGTHVQYSNVGYVAVGRIAEMATRTALPELVQTGFGSPDLSFDAAGTHRVHRDAGTRLDDGAMHEARNAAAGLCSSATTLLEIGAALLSTGDCSPISRATFDDMGQLRTRRLPRYDPIPADRRQWGLGFCRLDSERLRGVDHVGHAGLSGCQWWILPQNDTCLVLLTNRIGAASAGVDFEELIREVAELET